MLLTGFLALGPLHNPDYGIQQNHQEDYKSINIFTNNKGYSRCSQQDRHTHISFNWPKNRASMPFSGFTLQFIPARLLQPSLSLFRSNQSQD